MVKPWLAHHRPPSACVGETSSGKLISHFHHSKQPRPAIVKASLTLSLSISHHEVGKGVKFQF